MKQTNSKLMRSLSVAAAAALNDSTMESEKDMIETHSPTEVEKGKQGNPPDAPHAER